MARRLYVSGEGDKLNYCTASSREEALSWLGPNMRTPDPDDMRAFWRLAQIDSLTGAEIRKRFGVSRQTVCNWWKKAGGGDLPRRANHLEQQRLDKLKGVLLSSPPASASQVARQVNVSVSMVKQMAGELGVSLAQWQKRPSDAELIEMARGRTWLEFADAVGLKLSTLRTYIYARPELSEAIRKVRVPASTGVFAHGKLDREKALQLRKEGHSAYKIAQILRVEQMSVRHWLKRAAQEGLYDATCDERTPSDSVGGSGRGTARN